MTARPRGFIVITGSELVRGERRDLNGPFLAGELLRNGVEPVRISIVGDRRRSSDRRSPKGSGTPTSAWCRAGSATHDDTHRRARCPPRVGLRLDDELHEQIGSISRAFADRLGRPYVDFEAGVRKQATIPEGAHSLGLAGTAPGLVLEHGHTVIIVLPGPPVELQRLWRDALESEPVRALLARTKPPELRRLRFFGVSESTVAKALADAGGDGDGVEATICARDFEIHVDLVVEPGKEVRADELSERLVTPLEHHLFSRDERPIEELVLDLCRERSLTLGTAESCTGGMVAERLTSIPGSSEVFLGAVVAYADEVKARELGVPLEVLNRHGAVSAETAAAMATGVRERLGADVGVSVTGIAGPGGGSDEKPVGLGPPPRGMTKARAAGTSSLPGDRTSIRRRATVTALHLLRRLLEQSRDESA